MTPLRRRKMGAYCDGGFYFQAKALYLERCQISPASKNKQFVPV